VGRFKREIVYTLRRVLDVIGHYATAYLPGEAKTRIRSLFLDLPTRWVSLLCRFLVHASNPLNSLPLNNQAPHRLPTPEASAA
jgi:transcriptional repressor OPI1